MQPCRICLEPVSGILPYHPRCLRQLFRTSKAPQLEFELAKLHVAALEMLGHTSLSGVQKKVSLNLTRDRATLRVAAEGGRYILKPQTEVFPSIPENEHLTSRIALLAGIEVAPQGLVELADGSLAYVVRRFDRLDDGRKVRQEDFCQLALKSPKEKYTGSAELCVRLLRRYASEPTVEVLKLYRLLVFCWWTGNGDMHLKNFSLVADDEGRQRLSPAYDLLSTRLVLPDDRLALPVLGRDDQLTRSTWLKFADYCQLPAKVAVQVLDLHRSLLHPACELIARSYLPDDQQQAYAALLTERSGLLE